MNVLGVTKPAVWRERQVFDPDSIRSALASNLPDGLRALADAIESKQIEGVLFDVNGHGSGSWRDTRAHVMVKIDIAADVFVWKDGEKLPLDEAPTLMLPSIQQKEAQDE